MTPQDLTTFLGKTIPAGLPVLITGAPGIGKSDIVAQAAHACSADVILSHPAVSDPTDAKGLPWVSKDSDHATFLPFGELYRALNANKKTVWFLDDLGQASPAVQASFMQLLLARRVNGHVLPDFITFVAATNRRTDRAGVSGILEPVKSRFASIVELETNVDDWCSWAFGYGIPTTLIAFLRYKPDLLSQFNPTADLTNSPSPRTWANAAKIEALGLPPAIEGSAMAGSVGDAAAVEYLAFRKMFASLTLIDQILVDPDNAKIPSNKLDQMYAISVGLASRANDQNLPRIARFLKRLTDEGRGEFAALTLKDAVRRSPALTHTDAFIRLASGPLGKLISGGN